MWPDVKAAQTWISSVSKQPDGTGMCLWNAETVPVLPQPFRNTHTAAHERMLFICLIFLDPFEIEMLVM